MLQEFEIAAIMDAHIIYFYFFGFTTLTYLSRITLVNLKVIEPVVLQILEPVGYAFSTYI